MVCGAGISLRVTAIFMRRAYLKSRVKNLDVERRANGRNRAAHPTKERLMFDEALDDHRSPAPDAAPQDNPRPGALKDADIKSGTG